MKYDYFINVFPMTMQCCVLSTDKFIILWQPLHLRCFCLVCYVDEEIIFFYLSCMIFLDKTDVGENLSSIKHHPMSIIPHLYVAFSSRMIETITLLVILFVLINDCRLYCQSH